ncbi:MAG TPA: bifunctional riboflavin kinase/FAD synthetase [Longimicrobiales bacterium]
MSSTEHDARGDAARPPDSVITVGTFDGVHRGHVAVIDEVCDCARRLGVRSIVITFEPHPLRVVRPHEAPRLLTTPEERRELLAATGVDHVATLPFTRELATYSPERFVDEILIRRFGMIHLVMGYDHGLGRGRSGDVDTLRRIGGSRGFGVDVVPALTLDGEPISSTRIRKALERGDVVFAARALGRPYALRGRVIRGAGRGRELGFPTANLEPLGEHKLLPLEGIYAVRAHGAGARARDGVLHLGPRPTFEGEPPSIELHLFDFDGDLYGATLEVAFCGWIREIRGFAGIEPLVAAMREDCARARALFAAGRGACQG